VVCGDWEGSLRQGNTSAPRLAFIREHYSCTVLARAPRSRASYPQRDSAGYAEMHPRSARPGRPELARNRKAAKSRCGERHDAQVLLDGMDTAGGWTSRGRCRWLSPMTSVDAIFSLIRGRGPRGYGTCSPYLHRQCVPARDAHGRSDTPTRCGSRGQCRGLLDRLQAGM
jgi:hypothetical protein